MAELIGKFCKAATLMDPRVGALPEDGIIARFRKFYVGQSPKKIRSCQSSLKYCSEHGGRDVKLFFYQS